MIQFVILFTFFGTTFSSCPAMQNAYKQAVRISAAIGISEPRLSLIGPDDFGNVFFYQSAYSREAFDNFNRTITLQLAEQIFSSRRIFTTEARIRNNLRLHTSCIPEEQRSSTIPGEKCPKDHRYRSITGTCNNIKNPKWGKSYTPYGRIQPANYADGIKEIRRSVIKKEDLPEARAIANIALNKNPFKCLTRFRGNLGGIMFGQLMAHDQGMRQMIQTQKGGLTRTCCNSDYTKALSPQPFGCHAFKYTKDDPYLAEIGIPPESNITCMNFIRSQTIFPNEGYLGPAMAVNMVSHYLDLSPVYGNDVKISKELREFKNGLLKTSKGDVLPRTCTDPNEDCYLTGDFRGTAFYTLGVLQSMYHRLHNIVAGKLKKLHPKWSDEQLYQESRRICIAIYQNHVMDWLRIFVGEPETKQFRPIGNEYLGRYRSHVDASSTVEYSHCVFRIYHANLSGKFRLIDAKNATIKSMNIDDCDTGLKMLETNYEDVLRGMLQTFSAHDTYSAKVRNQMFNNGNKLKLGVDLISTDLFIGRDLGLQPYYVYFQKCTGRNVKSWNDLNYTIPEESIADLQKVYKSVYDVDTYTALALEEKCESYMGRVGKWLIVEQFERSRSGDRFFYSLPNGAYPFTPRQLQTIYNFSYSDFMCTVTELTEIQTRAFEVPSAENLVAPCKGGIDLSAWK